MKPRRITTFALTVTLALALAAPQSTWASNFPTNPPTQASDLLVKNEAVPFAKTTPEFPKQIPNYALAEQRRPEPIRLFKGGKWVVPIKRFDPARGGAATMSCQPFYWVLRWRSNNSDVTVRATAGMTDVGQFTKLYPPAPGGAGYLEGRSCVAPAFKFGRALRGNKANLVDVNFEYQIWKSQPKI